MRVAGFVLAMLGMATTAAAQTPAGTDPQPRLKEGFAVGFAATPALEGGGPWFMPSVRVSTPVAGRISLDVDAGRVFGGSHRFAKIHGVYTANLRFTRAPLKTDHSSRYWTAGLMWLTSTKLDGQGGVLKDKTYSALSIGYGWNQLFRNGARAVNEIGFSGGDGFMIFARLGVQWGPPRYALAPVRR